MISTTTQPIKAQAAALYERYAKPLEQIEKGKYIAISPEGKTLVDADMLELMKMAKSELGPGNFIFKIGDLAVGKWL
jgi:hypothetical protein